MKTQIIVFLTFAYAVQAQDTNGQFFRRTDQNAVRTQQGFDSDLQNTSDQASQAASSNQQNTLNAANAAAGTSAPLSQQDQQTPVIRAAPQEPLGSLDTDINAIIQAHAAAEQASAIRAQAAAIRERTEMIRQENARQPSAEAQPQSNDESEQSGQRVNNMASDREEPQQPVTPGPVASRDVSYPVIQDQNDPKFNAAVHASTQRAVREYPDYAVEGSVFQKKMNEIGDRLEAANNPVVFSSDAPYQVAAMAAKELGIPARP